MTHRWDYRTSPYVRIGFWTLLILAALALDRAGRTEVKVYTRGEGQLEVGSNHERLFRVQLPESDLTRLQVGMPAVIGWTAYPRAQYGVSQGSIEAITVADEHTNVAIKLDSPVLKTHHQVQPLQPGLSGTVQIVLDRKKATQLMWDWLKGY